jgi:hypothetical protein
MDQFNIITSISAPFVITETRNLVQQAWNVLSISKEGRQREKGSFVSSL